MRGLLASSFIALSVAAGSAFAADTIKIAYIDPLSGGGASVGEGGLKHFQWLADQINAAGGVLGKKIEILGLDNKTNPQESLVQAQKAIDQGARFLTQGNGSSVAAALTDFAVKNNDRNPDKQVLYSELRRRRSGLDERKMQLLAFPLGCQFRYQDAGADELS